MHVSGLCCVFWHAWLGISVVSAQHACFFSHKLPTHTHSEGWKMVYGCFLLILTLLQCSLLSKVPSNCHSSKIETLILKSHVHLSEVLCRGRSDGNEASEFLHMLGDPTDILLVCVYKWD